MAELLLFGDKNTADIKLRLSGSDGADYGGNPVYLHSQVLGKSEFYKTLLSERWSSEKLSVAVEGANSESVDDKQRLEVEVTSSHSMDDYIKCIKLMYSSEASKSPRFSSADEALAILPVASELLFHDCIEECMQYLDAVRWSHDQENLLLDLLSSLQIHTLPSLAARLGMSPCKSQCEHLEALEEFMPHLLYVIMNGKENRYCYCLTRDGVEKYIVGYFKGNTSPAIAEKCKSLLLKDLRDSIERIKSNNNDKDKKNKACSGLLWLIGVIRQCDGKLFEKVLYLFCEDANLRKALTSIESENYELERAIVNVLLNSFLEAMGNGKIVTPSSFRVSFLNNWVGTMVTLISVLSRYDRDTYLKMLAALDTGIAHLAETLSFGDQKLIYHIWVKAFSKHPMHHCTAIQWWSARLQDAIRRHH